MKIMIDMRNKTASKNEQWKRHGHSNLTSMIGFGICIFKKNAYNLSITLPHYLDMKNYRSIFSDIWYVSLYFRYMMEFIYLFFITFNCSALFAGDALFFHSNLLHNSAPNQSPHRRWAFLCAYNRASNNPVYEHHHPQYTPLTKVG